jgi:23S rRNA (guanosine2251-2'-O)-methyltransferase
VSDTEKHLKRKEFYSKMLTIYGKKPVLEALENKEIDFFRIHLTETKKPGDFSKRITSLAEIRGIEIVYHTRQSLARISRNINQDQGIAADLVYPNYQIFDDFIKKIPKEKFTLIALDGVTNPQNLGMIIRSVTASPCYGILLPSKGTAAISPLVIKASAGALFKCTLIHCDTLENSLPKLKELGVEACSMSSGSETSINDFKTKSSVVFVLGNETTGVSDVIKNICSKQIKIPMNNGVESLNVAVTAALLAFHDFS